ncbi:hypothetical protein [Acidihalobacter yilgarnensis]|uniref:hypothetical protein n=1 Tax=Acidihalobacter yilgarnensis TaxID=2819280 RepID=UPI0012EA00ED|nr:hypothetical protein [Acidihalobacter yilgarnensis]
MSLVSTVIVLLTIIGLAIWTGVLLSTGLTTGAVGTGTLTIVMIFFTWAAFVGVRSGQD